MPPSTNAGLILLGAGGHAKVAAAAALAAGWTVRGFLDDYKAGESLLGLPVLGGTEAWRDHPGCVFLIAIGSNEARRRLAAELECPWAPPLVHPRAWVDPHAELGEGTIVMAGAMVQPGAAAGRHAILNTSCSVDHDCRIGDFCHVCPGCHLPGAVVLEEGAMMGAGSCARPGVTIGAWTTVGAGAAVVSHLPPGVVAVGVPARPISG